MRSRDLLRLSTTGHPGIAGLFSKAHAAGWDFERDVDWSQPIAADDPLIDPRWSPFGATPTFQALPQRVQAYAARRALGRLLNSLQVGESVAQNVCAKLMLTLPEDDYRNHAAAQAMDEARHHLAYVRLLDKMGDALEDLDLATEMLFDAALAAERPVELVAMEQFIMEHLALELLDGLHSHATHPLLRTIIGLTSRDESRHVAFGVLYLSAWLRERSLDAQIDFARHWLRQALVVLMDRPGRIMLARVVARLREAGVDNADELGPAMLVEQTALNARALEHAASGRSVHPLLKGARRIGLLKPEIIEALNLARQPLLRGVLHAPADAGADA